MNHSRSAKYATLALVAVLSPPAIPQGPVPDITVSELMNDALDPAARALWGAVSFVVTAEGTRETSPESDEDWSRLREQAEVLLKAGTTLSVPNLRVTSDPNVVTPDYQFTPSEIEARLAGNPLPWRGYAQDMRMTTLQILSAIERRDLLQYASLGVTLNDACEGCHSEYWYRPQPMPGAEGVR